MKSDASPAEPPGIFKHELLPQTAKYIRLLEVLESNCTEDIKIRCKLTTWRITDAPPYHAISYTWGDAGSNATILIDEKPFTIRKNCEFVLKQARWCKIGRYYWVDSICIDQENFEEKSTQVSIMGKIYQQAAHVLASVGDHMDDSHFLFQKAQQILMARVSSEARRRMVIYLAGEVAMVRRLLWAAISFTQRPYFTRMWVLQEQQHAKQVTFLCGPDMATKEVVRNVTSLALTFCRRLLVEGPRESPLLAVRMWQPADPHAIPKSHDLARDREGALAMKKGLLIALHVLSEDPTERRISSLLDTASGLRCADNKDKIYGIVSLLDWGPVRPVKPDYTKTDFEVALDFVLAISRLRRHRMISSLTAVSKFTWRNLGLNLESDGVVEAVAARHGPPSTPESKPRVSSTAMVITGPGYVIQPGSLSDGPGCTTWTASRLNGWKIHLPPWARPGDFAVFSESLRMFSSPVLVRMVPFDAPGTAIGDEGGLVIGHGFCEASVYHGVFDEPHEHRFLIHWDVEDEMISSLVAERLSTVKTFSREWIHALGTGVCRRQTPVSSYAAIDWYNYTDLVP
ncbi:hypothetical protein KVR01_000659 [Diaporthe batatas]|uniref:uncharacterized protein n=1 Tax=Diaporthe batatas TaxID=748121 RepID=UPI001D037FA7|nr:uncharacterized protein KVR01_000659 [Diaporthe batatas]KAG8169914.1 hypothetical protein KVR01_000659 [Diaporthe batatas]